MIGPPPGVRVWLACGRTDMRKGMDGLAMLAQQVLNEDPFGGARLYKTGDVARYHADGSIECLGRNDFQIKLRGHRIDLGEIESVLRRFPNVCEAVVLMAPSLLNSETVTWKDLALRNLTAASRCSR